MSLRDLYQRYNLEDPPAEEVLRAELLALRDKHTNSRRRARIVLAYAEGRAASVAGRYGIAQTTIRSTAMLAMRAIRKRLFGLPRYPNGRPRGRGYGRRKAT